MFRLKHLFIPLTLLLLTQSTRAQFVNYGTDPARLKWNMARTTHYKLIYPQGADTLARQYAALLEATYPHVKKTIGGTPAKGFPVILHPYNMLSNGMVAWAPRRMELLTTPASDLYAQSWDRQLVLHEGRHVFQTNKLTQGIFRPLQYLIGEQTAGVAALFVPKWFFEGDAVTIETAMSGSGRGRLPEFNMVYRAQTMSDTPYTFDKWFLGSYKNHTGTYYALGYNLTAFARRQYGADIWNKVTTRYTRRIYTLPPFSKAFKHHTGIGVDRLFEQTFAFLKEEWQRQDSIRTASTPSAPTRYLSPETKHYTSYKHPQAPDDTTIIAVKTSLSDINSLVTLKNGQEKRLTYIGNINSSINLRNNRVYWTEYIPGIRWTHENFSVIKYYDINTKRTHTLTPRGRYLAPSVSPDGKTIAVSQPAPAGTHQIILISTETGKETARYDLPRNTFVKETTYAEDNRIIALTAGNNGIRILQIDTQTKQSKELLNPRYANITSPARQNGKLLFESGLDGTNNIYALENDTAPARRLTSARFGAFTPTLSPDGKELIYSDYTAKGYRIAAVPLDSLHSRPADFSRPYQFQLAQTVSRQEAYNPDTTALPPVDFQPRPYRRISHLIKIHSWAPFFYDINDLINVQTDELTTIVKPGAMVLTQNSLNTAFGQAGWYYRKGRCHGKLSFTYMGLYPIINMSVDYGGKAFDIAWKTLDDNRETLQGYYPDRKLIEADAQIYVPLNLTRNHYISGVQPIVTYYYTNNKYQQYKSREFRNFQYMLTELRYYRYRRLATRDILPRLGYQVRLQHLRTPFNTENYGSLYAARFTGYLPGIVPGNALMLRLGYQYQNIDNKALYIPKQLLDAPRGHNYNHATRQQWALKADYAFTIFHPDYSIGSWAYIKRMRGNIFYDQSHNQADKQSGWTKQSSYGADLLFDWNAIQAEFPLTLGMRITKPIQYTGFETELLFSISF